MKKNKQPKNAILLLIAIFCLAIIPCGRQAWAWTAGQPLTITFPRLGMWWPNPWEQSLNDIARYDYVLLNDYEIQFVPSLRSRNPDIILLNSTNACELSYDDPESDNYAQIQTIPAAWFLTQVGSTITQTVDAATTTFHVAATNISNANGGYELFVVGDTVLIEGETVLVEAVDTNANTLTVRRGFVRPASGHNAGVRLAAHITFWPDSWLLNLSMMSPTGVIDPVYGAERWADYHARHDAQLVTNPGWDGLLIDRADPNQSWLIGGSNARTIDPDQSNTLRSDYSAFDASWNAGLRRYETSLRQLVGDNKILFVNWGLDNYSLLNGNNYEGFPQPDGRSYWSDWSDTVFGPIPQVGGYLEWMANARQPNLTTIETYEDDSSPPPNDISYNNPCTRPGFVPNYQKMRFGLATALLGDGFYSYEINTNGHGSLCLLWFDEYDNAGAGRGYLGQPLRAAYRVSTTVLGGNLLSGGNFENSSDMARWSLWADAGYAATVSRDTGQAAEGTSSAKINVTRAGGTDWQISFAMQPVRVTEDTEYTLSFWAKADANRPLSVWAQQVVEPWNTYIDEKEASLGTTWKKYEYTVISTGTDPATQFTFGLGQTTGTVFLDDVRLQTGSREVWRRDFQNGIVLLNNTNQPQQIGLGGKYKKINGRQDRAINNGSVVSSVTLDSRDGIILLRIAPPILPRNTTTSQNIAPIMYLLLDE